MTAAKYWPASDGRSWFRDRARRTASSWGGGWFVSNKRTGCDDRAGALGLGYIAWCCCRGAQARATYRLVDTVLLLRRPSGDQVIDWPTGPGHESLRHLSDSWGREPKVGFQDLSPHLANANFA